MTAFDRIEPRIPELMDELAPAQVPDYFDDMLRQTARTRQRPAWLSSRGGSPWASSPAPIDPTGPVATDRHRRRARRRRGDGRGPDCGVPAAAPSVAIRADQPDPGRRASRPRWFAADDTSLWVHEPTSLVRVDLATSAITGTVPLTSIDYGYDATGAGAVWQTDYGDDVLLRIDPVAGKVLATIPVGSAPEGVAVTAGSVWVANEHDGSVTRIDPATNQRRRDDPGRSDGTSGPQYHDGWTRWCLGGRPEQRVGRAGRCRDEQGRPAGAAGQASWRATVRRSGSASTQGRTGRRRSCASIRSRARSSPRSTSIPRASTAWPSASDPSGSRTDGGLTRIDAATGRIVGHLDTGGDGGNVVVAGGAVWVAADGQPYVLRILPP